MLNDLPRDRLRLSLLATVATIALATVGNALFQQVSKPAKISYLFPATVPLTGWQLVDARPLDLNKDKQPEKQQAGEKPKDVIPAQVYRFEKGGVTLEAKTYYLAPATEGNVTRYLFVYSPLRAANANMKERQQSTMGSYGVLTHEGRAYLTACTTNQGGSTLTEKEFIQNRSRHDLNVGNIIMWLAGQRDLRDLRCLWTLMSVPIAGGTTATPEAIEQAYRQLETVWVPWHQWWQQNFPPLTSR